MDSIEQPSVRMAMQNSNDQDNDLGSNTFRSVLPHEPLPNDEFGYIHMQGGFEPKRKPPQTQEKSQKEDDKALYWTKSRLEHALHRALSGKLPHAADVQHVSVLEDASSPPFTKVRLCYKSPLAALQVVQACRSGKISPSHLFQDYDDGSNGNSSSDENYAWQFNARPLQATLLTTQSFLSSHVGWNRSNPPKFRRLICRPGEAVELLQEHRQSTRFVFMSGLVDITVTNNEPTQLESSWWGNARNVCESIRHQINAFDTSGKGVEIYVANKKNKATHFCHIGMRSPEDARALIAGLQGKSLQWQLHWNDNDSTRSSVLSKERAVHSDKLFLDYAAVTMRSTAKATARENGESGMTKGEPSRSECTSSTSHVTIPGLYLVPDFMSKQEEQVLMAALTGPTAPWAPLQSNASQNGAVKRRVQHYGYVFDYETADVKRDRSLLGCACPPLPGLPTSLEIDGTESPKNTDLIETYFRQCVSEGRGWDALAATVERTRQREFVVPDVSGDESKSTLKRYPNLNQITVNVYEPGEGIGSHIDTPSAFEDGLISISLNGGVVMEFRKQNADDKIKKLVYLPPRSLLLMSGPARYEYEHMIVTRMTDTHDGKVLPRNLRVSLTLRTAIDLSGDPLPSVTTRSFPPVWGGSDNNSQDSPTDALVTPAMEREHVHAVYDAIATQWHHTRGKRGTLWPGATQFLTELPQGSIVADVGCGDGKYFPAIWEAGSYVIGSDISLPLLQQAAYRGKAQDSDSGPSEPESRKVSEHRHHLRKLPAVVVADCMNVPLRTKSCDAAICIAVMHHLSTRERRIRCISELSRIVKVGGMINIQAWAMEQQEKSKRKFAGTDVFVPFNAQPKYLNKVEGPTQSNGAADTALSVRNEETASDVGQVSKSMAQVYSEEYNAQYNEKNGLVVFKRYCHMYRSGELEELVAQVDAVTLQESGYETGNHFVILRVVK